MSINQVFLKYTSRPLRLVYLAATRDHVLQAVRLYTHIWGGEANYILPIPPAPNDVDAFKQALFDADPDFILVSQGIDLTLIERTLSESPAAVRPITPEQIEAHVIGGEFLRFYDGTLPHVGHVIQGQYPNKLPISDFYLSERSTAFPFATAMQHGLPSDLLRKYMTNHLAATQIKGAINLKDLIYSSIILTKWNGPLSNTLMQCRISNNNFFDMDVQTLWLYLDDEKSIDTATTYWNTGNRLRANRLFLPRKDFILSLESSLSLLLKLMPTMHALSICLHCDEDTAIKIRTRCKAILERHNKPMPVRIIYGGFRYNLSGRYLTTGSIINETQVIHTDNSVRFRPTPPLHHETRKALFGYNVEVTLGSGEPLALPSNLEMALLLSNELLRIMHAEQNHRGLGNLWLLPLTVRPMFEGVTGFTLAGRECRFFLHDQEIIVTRFLKLMGFEVKTNTHTRYASGFIKRFGGIDKTLALVNSGGSDIMLALRAHRAEQCGLLFDQIVEFLRKQRHLTDAQQIVEKHLPKLLERELVRRGYPLLCPHCDLRDWYPFEEARELIECNGCGGAISVPLRIPFSYTLNQLARRFIETGGRAVLVAADALLKVNSRSSLQFGGDVFQIGSRTNLAEVDLFWLSAGAFGITECKSYDSVTDTEVEQFKSSLIRNIERVAIPAEIDFVLLAVSANNIVDSLFEMVSHVAKHYEEQGVGVHLVLNGKFHLSGKVDAQESGNTDISDLIIKLEKVNKTQIVGQELQAVTLGGLRDAYDETVLLEWISSNRTS